MLATRKTLDQTVHVTSGSAGGVDERDAARHGQHLLGGCHDTLGVAAAVDEGADLVADLPLLDAVTDRRDATAHLEARVLGCARRRRVVAEALHDVRPVDPGGDDVDEHLAGLRLGVGHLVEDEAVGVSGLGDRDGAHGPSLLSCAPGTHAGLAGDRRVRGDAPHASCAD